MVGDSHARCSKVQHGRVDRTTWLSLGVGFAAVEGNDGVRGGRTGVEDEDWLAMRRSVMGLVDSKPAVAAIWIGGNAMTQKPAASPVVAHQDAAERGSKIAEHVARFIAFVREALPDVAPLSSGPVPPHLADQQAVAARRSMAELLRITAKKPGAVPGCGGSAESQLRHGVSATVTDLRPLRLGGRQAPAGSERRANAA